MQPKKMICCHVFIGIKTEKILLNKVTELRITKLYFLPAFCLQMILAVFQKK